MVRRTIRLPQNLDEILAQIAKQKGLSKNALIVEACWMFIESKREMWQFVKDEQKK